jgi:hypothetical protein
MTATRLDVQLAALESCAASPAAIGLLSKVGDDGTVVDPEFKDMSRARILGIAHTHVGAYFLLEPDAFYRHVLTEGTLTIASSTAFRVSAWQSMGGFARGLSVAWDLDFSCRLASLGPVVFVDDIVGFYRLHDANTSAQGLTSYREVIRVKQRHFAHPRFPLDRGWLERDIRDRLLGLAYHESLRGNVRQTVNACVEARNYGVTGAAAAVHMLKGVLRSIRATVGESARAS